MPASALMRRMGAGQLDSDHDFFNCFYYNYKHVVNMNHRKVGSFWEYLSSLECYCLG